MFIAYAPGQMDDAGLVHQLRSAGIEVLYLGGYGPEAGRIVKEARQQGSRLRLIGDVTFDAKGDLLHADWQWQVWRDGSYAPLQVDVAIREPNGH